MSEAFDQTISPWLDKTELGPFLDQFQSHLVGLSWIDALKVRKYQGSNESENYSVRALTVTSFVITLSDVPFLVAAGHVLQDIKRITDEDRRIVKARLIHPLTNDGGDGGVPFDLDPNSFLFDTHEGVDIGLIPLRPAYFLPLEAAGLVALDSMHWNAPPREYAQHYMIGLPSETKSHRLIPTGDGSTRVQIGGSIPLLPLFPISEPPACLVKKREQFFARVPIGKGELDGQTFALDDIDGMSGGPIFGAWEEDGQIKYRLVAVQGSWLRSERIIAATYVAPVFNAIEQDLEKRLPRESTGGTGDGPPSPASS